MIFLKQKVFENISVNDLNSYSTLDYRLGGYLWLDVIYTVFCIKPFLPHVVFEDDPMTTSSCDHNKGMTVEKRMQSFYLHKISS